ncbi:MAG: hypothetical protein KAJ51_03150 [Thermoplasmata archaeon]|nr:hypothetical protein [Thermoplasmata archaeon]
MQKETSSKKAHREYLMSMSKEQLVELMFTHLRNMWSVDGLYYIGIEEKFGTQAATEIDANVWAVMGKLEARRLREVLGIEPNDIESVAQYMKATGWHLDLEDVELEIEDNKIIERNIDCRVQTTRIKKGLGEFPCKPVRFGYLKSFFKKLNPNIEVKCNKCPPDVHSDGLWCEWLIELH